MKDYSYLRRMTTQELCKRYVSLNCRIDILHTYQNEMKAILFLVGHKNLMKYIVVNQNQEIAEEEFDDWYMNDPRSLTMQDIKATLG